MIIAVYFDPQVGLYGIEVNGKVTMECLAEDEINALTIGEIRESAKEVMK